MNTVRCEHNSFLGVVLNAVILAAILLSFGWIIAMPLAVVFYLYARKEGFAAALERSASVMRAIAALICWAVVVLMVIWLARDFGPIFSNLAANVADLVRLLPNVIQAMVK